MLDFAANSSERIMDGCESIKANAKSPMRRWTALGSEGEMADHEKPASWWQTTPGIMTGVAALLAALTGLIHELSAPSPPVSPEVRSQIDALTAGHNGRLEQLQSALIRKREEREQCKRVGPCSTLVSITLDSQVEALEKDVKAENDAYQASLKTLRR
jgi:hypothetical protein